MSADRTLGRVFVTGASGFMGQVLVERIRADGHEVVGIDLQADEAAGISAGDTTRPGPWRQLVEGCDTVIHTAAIVSFDGDDDLFWNVNVLGTRNVLDAAVDAGVSRFVHISSITAFGFDYPDGVDESWPVRCNGSPYVDTKVAGEQVVLQAHAAGEIECTVIRPGDVYGPRSRAWTIEPVKMIKAGKAMVPGGGEGTMSPVYIDNLIDGIVLAASTSAAAGRVITITDGVAVPTHEWFNRYARMIPVDPPRMVSTRLARAGASVLGRIEKMRGRPTELNAHSINYLARRGTYSIGTAESLLGYKAEIDFDEGMARTESWLRDEGLI